MNYAYFLQMHQELSLCVVMIIVLLSDLIINPSVEQSKKKTKLIFTISFTALLIHTLLNLTPSTPQVLFGGMYGITSMGDIMKTILNIATILVVMMSRKFFERDDSSFKQGEFYFLLFATLFGMYMMISAEHFLMFFIGLETASLPMAALVAIDKYRNHSSEAGAKYILMTLFSSALLLFGLSMLYGACGTLYFDDLFGKLQVNPLEILALTFFLGGMGFKISLVPFHLWTADVYEGAPTSVTAYLSIVSKASACFVLMTILLKVFGPLIEQWQLLLYALIVLSITIANIFAIRQQNIKRFMAFSSISQAGYIMLAVISGRPEAMANLVYYILVYLFSNMAVFFVISLVERESNGVGLKDYRALYRSNPKLSFVMMVALFSLAGIPPFAGFFSKFFVFMTAFQEGFHLLVFIALINTVISLYYYLLIVKAMFIQENETPVATIKTDNISKIALLICMAGIMTLGIASCVFEFLNQQAIAGL